MHSSACRYFLAGRNTHPAVVAVSLLSGLTSGITVLGMPGLVTAEAALRRDPYVSAYSECCALGRIRSCERC